MRIMLTGASGLLGRHTAKLLRERGHSVITVARNRKLDGETILADLSSPAELERLPKEFDCLVHLAAVLPAPNKAIGNEAWFLTNTQATLNLLEFCSRNKVRNFVYGSTWSVYGMAPEGAPYTEDAEPRPTDLYSLSKLSGELLTSPYQFNYGLEIKILRFSYIYGPGMREDTVVEKFIDFAVQGRAIPLLNQGRDGTDLVYVEDAAKAIEAALSRGRGIYNVGSGEPVTIKRLAEAVIDLTRSSSRLEVGEQASEAKIRYVSIEKAMSELDWKPGNTLRSGLKMLIDQRRPF